MKKFISILVAVMLVASVVVTASAYTVWPSDDPAIEVLAKTSDEALAEYAAEFGEVAETNKYYFQMPDGVHGMRGAEGNVANTWFNEYTQGAGVYWWGSAPAACEAWAGYQSLVEKEEENIFYANVPKAVVAFIWNNGIDGTMDEEYPLYFLAAQTVDVACEYPDPGEYTTMPEGADSFDECIFIVNPDEISINPLSNKQTCGGTWYFYYGDGCYGMYAKGSGKDVCCNPDHFKDADTSGEHIGFQPAIVEPTEEPTEEPTDAPTDAPTEAPTEEPTVPTVPIEDPTEPAPTYIRGDYDNDGIVGIMDATRVQRILADLETRPEEAFLIAVDADGDGILGIMDATRIQRVLAGLCDWDGNIL